MGISIIVWMKKFNAKVGQIIPVGPCPTISGNDLTQCLISVWKLYLSLPGMYPKQDPATDNVYS